MSMTSSSLALPRLETAAQGGAAHPQALPLEAARVSGAQWDAIASGFDGICQEQLHAYAADRWPATTLEPIVFSHRGEKVGGALVMLQKLPLGVATLAVVKWGPILADNSGSDADAVMSGIVDYLVAEYADRRRMMVSIMPKVEADPNNKQFAALAARGFRPGMGIKYPDRYVVDVRPDDETRMACFAQKWRYHLRKSFKAGLAFEAAEENELERFMALYQAMSDRKQFPDYSAIGGLDALMAMPEGTARPKMFFVSKDGETVAGAVIFTHGDTATYLYGATNDAALGLRAGYFMHWHIIRWLRDNTRVKQYDLGGTDGFQGLHQFKSGMVGDAGFINPVPPFADYASDVRARLFGTLASKGYDRLRRARNKITAARLALIKRLRNN